MSALSKLALLLYTISAGQEKLGPLGHTQLQKLVYLVQATTGVPAVYEFRMHYYGPYSGALWDDIQTLSTQDILDIKDVPYPPGYKGHEISVKQDARPSVEQILANEAVQKAIEPYTEAVSRLLDLFPGKGVRELELLGTVHFVYRQLATRAPDRPTLEPLVIRKVKEIKPHFTDEDVQRAASLLTNKGLL